MLSLLEDINELLMNNRDYQRFDYMEIQSFNDNM